ncbi:glucose-1-phosphate thymidylyltransferase RfbA [Planctomycetaceae bacterium SH139]
MRVTQGIILAGGHGTRLAPLTEAFSKQLLPVYDKPLIYYPLSTLMLAGIRDIVIVTTPHDQGLFVKLLGDGDRWGMRLRYVVQTQPRGLADAISVASELLAGGPLAMILGDNIFYGRGFTSTLAEVAGRVEGATLFAYPVLDPSSYGVIELSAVGQPLSIEEKPSQPRSNLAVTGLYFYDARVFDLAAKLQPSSRGELEITDLNRLYLQTGSLRVEILGRGFTWMDAGTLNAYMEAGRYVHSVESRQGLKIGCPEEIAWRLGYIDTSQLQQLADRYGGDRHDNAYGAYLARLVRESK